MTSNRRYPRTARLNEVVLEVVAEEVERLSDPRLDLVTITGVDVTRDLSQATVYFSTLAAAAAAARAGDRDEGDSDRVSAEAGAALGSASSHLRNAIGRQMRVRQVPKLLFKEDPGIREGQRIEQILRDIHRGDGEVDEDLPE